MLVAKAQLPRASLMTFMPHTSRVTSSLLTDLSFFGGLHDVCQRGACCPSTRNDFIDDNTGTLGTPSGKATFHGEHTGTAFGTCKHDGSWWSCTKNS